VYFTMLPSTLSSFVELFDFKGTFRYNKSNHPVDREVSL
jgi:hypothetical protein